MGQQQLLLIILGVIIVGIAIAVGITLFGSSSISSNKDAIVADINNIAANAFQYKIRPSTMGGGGGTYGGYKVPVIFQPNDNGSYGPISAVSAGAKSFTITGDSKPYPGSAISAVIDSTGVLTSFTYTGEFQ